MSADKPELIPENPLLWTEGMLWAKDITLRSGIGYKDNVFLTPTASGSGFFINGLDLLVHRIPLDGLEFTVFVTGDDTRYWHDVPPPTNSASATATNAAANPSVDHEDIFLASAQVQKYFASNWRAGAEVRESYVDQVQYILFAGTQRGSNNTVVHDSGLTNLVVNGHLIDGRLSLRRNLFDNWRGQLDGLANRALFGPLPLDNSWKYGPKLTLGHDYGKGSDVALTYSAIYEIHDQLLARDATNNVIPGRNLATWQQRVELTSQHVWDTNRHWRSATTLSFQDVEDNGGGFYNVYRYSLTEELRYHTARWELRAGGRISYEDFPVVRADGGLTGPKLHRELWGLRLRGEREIYKALRAFGEFSHEQTLSNSPTDEYKANVVMGGLSFEF